MDLFPFLLVIISAVTHGSWNFLTKLADNKDVFVGLSKISEALLFLVPYALFLNKSGGYGYSNWYLFVLVASCFVFLNYFFLSQAYERIELSIAYPISRSSTLFLPLLGFIFLREHIDLIGFLAIGLITMAVLILQLNAFSRQEMRRLLHNLARPGIIFALSAAFMAASYTIWDKMAVAHIQPFLYFYGYTAVTAVFYLVMLRRRYSMKDIRHEWGRHKLSILSVGVLNTFTYLMVLVALGLSKASYVGAVRQISLVVGVILGWRFLNEKLPSPKLISVLLLIAGSLLIAFAK